MGLLLGQLTVPRVRVGWPLGRWGGRVGFAKAGRARPGPAQGSGLVDALRSFRARRGRAQGSGRARALRRALRRVQVSPEPCMGVEAMRLWAGLGPLSCERTHDDSKGRAASRGNGAARGCLQG